MTTSSIGSPGYLVPLKDSLVLSLRSGFGPTCPWPQFQSMFISINYPKQKAEYPGIWVDFEPVGNITRGGIDQPYAAYVGSDGRALAVSRWRAQGYATLTLGAMSSTERDLLYDIVIAMIAFSHQPPYMDFRYNLEIVNPLIDVELNADTITNRGMSESPSPFQTDETIYEVTLALELAVEFAAPAPVTPLPTLEAIDLQSTLDEVTTDVDIPPAEG